MKKFTGALIGVLLALAIPLGVYAVIGSSGSIGGTQYLTAVVTNFTGSATTTNLYPPSGYSLSIGTTTNVFPVGLMNFNVYGTTTLQSRVNSLYAFRVLNSASSSVFTVNTVSGLTTVTGDLTVTGTCTGCASGGSPFAWTPQSWGNSTSTVLSFPGFISTASSTLSYLGTGGLAVNNGLIYNAATSTLSTITGTLTVSKGGTGQTSFNQGWLHSDGTTLTSSTSPTVNYLTATSTTATSTFAYGVYVGGRLQLSGLGANCEGTTSLASNETGFVYCQTLPLTSNWTDGGAYLSPLTVTDGILINSASSTITNLLTVNATSTNATTTGTFTLPVGSVITPLAGNMAIDTTTGQLRYSDVNGTTRNIVPYYPIGFTFASSSAGKGTTTRYMTPARAALTVTKVRCETNSWYDVSLYDGTNRADLLRASSTIGTFSYSTNNTFTANESMRVDIGTTTAPATQVYLSCGFDYTYTSD